MDSAILTIDNLLVLTTVVSFCISLTPPNAPIPQEQMLHKTFFERTIVFRVFLHKVLLCALSFLHIVASFSRHSNGSSHDSIMTIGTFICLVSACLRLWCFSTLGRFFDFQATVKSDHELITSGPYAYVRHPSYAGLAGSYIGSLMVIFSAGHWFREYALLSLAGKVVGVIWCLESLVIFVGVPRRSSMEDEALKRRFGKEWEEFARKVPFKVVPGIY